MESNTRDPRRTARQINESTVSGLSFSQIMAEISGGAGERRVRLCNLPNGEETARKVRSVFSTDAGRDVCQVHFGVSLSNTVELADSPRAFGENYSNRITAAIDEIHNDTLMPRDIVSTGVIYSLANSFQGVVAENLLTENCDLTASTDKEDRSDKVDAWDDNVSIQVKRWTQKKRANRYKADVLVSWNEKDGEYVFGAESEDCDNAAYITARDHWE